MSDTTHHNDLPHDDALAAEYALGVGTQTERQAAERRIASDRTFANLVAQWETRLAPWSDAIAPVQPSHEVWSRIDAALPQQRAVPHTRGVAFWRGWAVGATGLAFASIAALFFVLNAPAARPLVASIDGGGHHHFVATIDPVRGSIAVVPAAFTADATRVAELWLIPADGKPRSLGLLRADQAVTLKLPPTLPRKPPLPLFWRYRWSREAARRPALRRGPSLPKASSRLCEEVHASSPLSLRIS